MTGYPFIKDNIEALKEMGHPVYTWLASGQYDQEDMTNRLFINDLGLHDWRMDNGTGIFEALPPVGAYKNWNPGEKAGTSATIIVGCNLGYGVNHVLMNTPDTHKVILLEPRPEMLMACLGQTDYRPFMEAKKLHLMVPDENYIQEVIRNLDMQFIYGQIHLRGDLPSRQIGPEYAHWTRIIKEKLENFSLELSTLRHRQDTMVSNELKNFRRALNDGSLLQLEGAAHGMGAVILGAGPSIAETAPKLAADPGNMLYTTALQTLPVLQQHGLKPHICLAIDFDDSMLKVYDRLDPEFARNIPLIYSTKLNPEVVERYPGPTVPLWTVGGMGTFVMKDRELVLDAGGNVSLALARFLRWCGVSHIVLAGQDFAYVGARTHANGHHATGNLKFNPRMHQRITDIHGNELISSIQYLTAKREMEEDLTRGNFPVFNLYGGGAPIDGTTPESVEQARMRGHLASTPGSVTRFLAALETCRTIRPRMSAVPQGPSWAASLRNVEKRLRKLFKHVADNQEEIHKTMQQVEEFIKQDALYIPYLYNETVDMAGLTRAKFRYEAKDFQTFRTIMKTVIRKVREVDRHVCPKDTLAA